MTSIQLHAIRWATVKKTNGEPFSNWHAREEVGFTLCSIDIPFPTDTHEKSSNLALVTCRNCKRVLKKREETTT